MQYTSNYNLKKPDGTDNVDIQDFNDNAQIVDTALTPTADPTKVPASNGAFKLIDWVSYLTNRIKAITGKANWYDVPSKTLEDVNTHISDTTAAHGATSAATASKIIIRDAAGRAKVAAPSAADDIARKDTVDAVQGNLASHLADNVAAFAAINTWIQRLNKLYNKKWNAMGDSITKGGVVETNCYPAVIASRNDATVRNYGLPGSAIRYIGDGSSIAERYEDMDDDADYITVFGGANDYIIQTAIGTINSSDNTTFYGALNEIALGLIEKYPGKKIALITPMQQETRVGNSITLADYAAAVENISLKYGIPCLNLLKDCNLYPDSSDINTAMFVDADGIHPNAAGQLIIADRIEGFLRSL